MQLHERTGAAVIMPAVDIEAMNEHLAEIGQCVRWAPSPCWYWMVPAGTQLASAQRAGQHRAAAASTVFARLNPVENVWEFLRGNFLSHRVWETYEEIMQACRYAWNQLMQMPGGIASITRRSWAQPVIG